MIHNAILGWINITYKYNSYITDQVLVLYLDKFKVGAFDTHQSSYKDIKPLSVIDEGVYKYNLMEVIPYHTALIYVYKNVSISGNNS